MFLPTDLECPDEKEKMEMEGPLSLLHRSAIKMTEVLIGLRNNKKVIGNIVSYDRHYNLLLSKAKEINTMNCKKKKKAHECFRELGNVFIRGDSVILVASAPQLQKGAQSNEH